MFTCRALVEELREHLDGEMPWYRRWLLELHLLLCPACRAYLASYQSTRRLAKGLSELDAGTALPEDLSVRLHATLIELRGAAPHPPDPPAAPPE